MDIALINSEIARLISAPETAFFAGIFAAFTPCTLALIPIFLYRFGVWKLPDQDHSTNLLKRVREIGLLLSGYLISFMLFGWILGGIFSSDLVNSARLFLGLGMIFVGVLQIGGQISFSRIEQITNPFLSGLTIPIILSFSPCVLPVISPLVAAGVGVDSMIRFLLFGLGILVPAIIIGLAGNWAMMFARRSTNLMVFIEKSAAAMIILSGIYLGSQVMNLTFVEILFIAILVGGSSLLVIYRVLIKQNLFTVWNFGLSLTAIIVLVVTTLYAEAQIIASTALSGEDLVYACSTLEEFIKLENLLIVFGYGSVAALMGYMYINRYRKSRKLNFKMS